MRAYYSISILLFSLSASLSQDRLYLDHAIEALEVMQAEYHELWIGTWPSAIDWTAAVVHTHVSALLDTVTRHNLGNETIRPPDIIHRYFAHTIAYYFGEDFFSLRNEAYDDMLWVVLGWLESVKFISNHNLSHASWYGTEFIPGFAHRARIFWDLALRGWDTSICDGGMLWNPRFKPYKNAITNQLFISASISMYLYFPGDNNSFPFMAQEMTSTNFTPGRQYDPKYLKAAIDGYAWLKNSNMTNSQGLYVDGFHVKNWGLNGTVGTGKCDRRNEMVYTYNQGVILSGLRGLWESTGDPTYLHDGYTLIHDVMTATGWSQGSPDSSAQWAGLGHSGILQERCDPSGRCNQDAQTFKGIFFQHLAAFCMPLPRKAAAPGKTHHASTVLAALHRSNCLVVGVWVSHNAKAALRSRDAEGRFGMWWAKPSISDEIASVLPPGAEDYRNDPTILTHALWSKAGLDFDSRQNLPQHHLGLKEPQATIPDYGMKSHSRRSTTATGNKDPNDRGRGRTVETQSGGLAVLRAAWELMYPGSD
ncbi:glycosyl hydrolase family 76-domain-containing protein [Delphinella strobiligena]|nr:glycosyl hydrolase family 76-domain-containing protein [Delphinella strobiligena]